MHQCILPRASKAPRGRRVGVSLGLKGLVSPAKVWQRSAPCGFPLDPPLDPERVGSPGPDLTCAAWSWDEGSCPGRPF
eukprot:2854195-Pyramimonas_sp.AAC.1